MKKYPRLRPPRSVPAWQRNLYVIWIAEVLSIAGFSIVLPFLPYYVQDLGVRGEAQVAFWTGLLFSGQAVLMSIVSPIWGTLADRYGRKLMVERAMFAGAVVVSAMGFAQSVGQLLALRILQGGLTGTVAAATTLVASTAPRERVGFALGALQMAIYVGASLGPLLGGVIADTLGYRPAFWVTGGLLFIAGVLVLFLVHEEFPLPTAEGDGKSEGLWEGLRMVIRSRALRSVFGVRLLTRLSMRTVGPILPLFIQVIAPAGTRIASTAGLVTGVSAASSAVGAIVLGRASDRLGPQRVLLGCTITAALLYLPQSLVQSPNQLLVLQVLVGIPIGGTLASLSALLATLAPEGRQGAVYGVDASVVSAANGLGPMLGAAIAAGVGLRPVFVGVALLFSVSAWGVMQLDMRSLRK